MAARLPVLAAIFQRLTDCTHADRSPNQPPRTVEPACHHEEADRRKPAHQEARRARASPRSSPFDLLLSFATDDAPFSSLSTLRSLSLIRKRAGA